jgi:trk system potassium uptake protein TrkA
MRVLILGAGRVGYSIARYFAYEEYTDYEVTIVDNDPQTLERVAEKLDIQPILGHASHPDVLQKAGCAETDLMIAVTASDEVNIVACEVVKSLFDIPIKIARVRSNSYLSPEWIHLFQSQTIAVDRIISPETEVARSLTRSTEIVGAFQVIPLNNNRIKVIGVRVQSAAPILNTPIRLLATVLPHIDMVLLNIVRDNYTFFPKENDEIKEKDEVFFATTSENITQCMEAFGHFDHIQRSVLIVGGGNIGYGFAQSLEQIPNMEINIIEKDVKRCEFLARNLTKAEVFQGDALDTDVLNNLNLHNCESVVAVTNEDKVNILASLMVKRQGAERCLTLLNNDQYTTLVTSLGVDGVISPKAITVSTILQNIRCGRIENVHTIADGYSEIIEVITRDTSHIVGISAEDINIPDEMMIVALVRSGVTHFLPQQMIISVHDVLIILAKKESIRKVDRLLSARPAYL